MDAKKYSLLSSQARIQTPWIKVTFGDPNSDKANSYTFGIFDRTTKEKAKDNNGFYSSYKVQFPSYIKSLDIVKTNGQINQYTLSLDYPVKPGDDPNFIEKVLSSISTTRKIIFSYGDASMPSYCYKDEEAILTGVNSDFSIENSTIKYTIKAVSSAALGQVGCFTFMNNGYKKPSDEIKRLLRSNEYGLQNLFTGMNSNNIDNLIASDDKEVQISTKVNISPLDYISYLVSCMVPMGSVQNTTSKDIYVLTIHDDTIYDKIFYENAPTTGAYFRVERNSYKQSSTDAYEIDIGFNSSTIVSNFSVDNQDDFALYFAYAKELYPEQYTRRLNNSGQWEDVYSPIGASKNEKHLVRPEDVSWYTKITKYPIKANITVQGLLKPAMLMTNIRLNVIFPGGNKHIASGLYVITKQVDSISERGYKTALSLTKISGDTVD